MVAHLISHSQGETFEIQVFAHDQRAVGAGRVLGLGDGVNLGAANIATSLTLNTLGAGGGTGQFALGTFTADATGTQNFEVFGSFDGGATFTASNGAAQINAIQLRVVPEPASFLTLVLLGLVGALSLRPKRRG